MGTRRGERRQLAAGLTLAGASLASLLGCVIVFLPDEEPEEPGFTPVPTRTPKPTEPPIFFFTQPSPTP